MDAFISYNLLHYDSLWQIINHIRHLLWQLALWESYRVSSGKGCLLCNT